MLGVTPQRSVESVLFSRLQQMHHEPTHWDEAVAIYDAIHSLRLLRCDLYAQQTRLNHAAKFPKSKCVVTPSAGGRIPSARYTPAAARAVKLSNSTVTAKQWCFSRCYWENASEARVFDLFKWPAF